MKQTGGYIVNVSSYFGGEKYVAIPYPNRSDYAVSKAGQRAWPRRWRGSWDRKCRSMRSRQGRSKATA